jgi:hypothetical protein
MLLVELLSLPLVPLFPQQAAVRRKPWSCNY